MNGKTTLAKLESMGARLVGARRYQFSVYVIAAKAQCEFGLFGVTSATVRAFLLGATLYTTAHYKNTACKTSSRTAVAKQTRPARFYASIQATATTHAQFIGLNTGC